MMSSSSPVALTRRSLEGEAILMDQVAIEEPLEIIVDGYPVAVVMRTPEHDEELAAGFLVTEGVTTSLPTIRKIEVRPEENRVLIFLADDAVPDITRLTRHLFTGSSCGLCGKATLDSIFVNSPPIGTPVRFSDDVFLSAPEKLRASQSTFDATGGLHGAAVFSRNGDLLLSREDIGRHNAVDKVIGRALLDGLDLSETFLLVSGRASFEILQKALAARIPAVGAVSAPSSLAVDFARRSGQTLIGFLRPPTFNRYTD